MSSAIVVAPPSAIAAAPPPDRPAQPSIAAHPFAEMLRQNRLAATTTPTQGAATDKAEPAPAPAAAPEDHDAAPPGPSAPRSEPAPAKARATGPSRAAVRSVDEEKTPTADAPTSVSTTPVVVDGKPDAPATAASPSADAVTLANAQAIVPRSTDIRATDLRGAAATSEPSARGGNAPASGAATPLPFDASTTQGAVAGTAGGRSVNLSAADDATARGDPAADKGADASTTGSFATLLAETKSGSATGSPGDRTGHDALAQAQPAAFATPATAAAGNAATTATTTLPVPVHSPEFAAAFGLQVSGLAKDGIQHAELHLNPAEMGPVSIQITLDGTQARVDFGADVAATRHAIESGLPELASALRDAGFTLAGGGVAQHSSSGGNGDDGSRRGTSTAASATAVASVDAAAQRLSRNVAAGGVDVYA